MFTVISCLCFAIGLIHAAYANIILQHDPLRCDPNLPGSQGCLRGQLCTPYGTCKIASENAAIREPPMPSTPIKRSYTPLSDDFTLIHNDVSSASKEQVHVRAGSVSHFEDSSTKSCENTFPDSYRRDIRQVNLQPGEGSEPILEPHLKGNLPVPTSSTRNESTTVNGLCGPNNKFAKCNDWPAGPCCSAYGFCGKTISHCLYACQDGPCLNQSAIKPINGTGVYKHSRPGRFEVVGQSGVPAMAAGLMPNGKVFFLDKVENYTQLKLDNGQYAYSAEYDPVTNEVVALPYKTNAFCSGGAFLADGRVIAVGGNGPLDIDSTVGDGFDAIRYLQRSHQGDHWDGSPWFEPGNKLSSPRWYASAQTLTDGRVFVASGSMNGLNPTRPQNNNPTYEILDRSGYSTGPKETLSILERNQPYYMYPFIHLLKDGTLFIFAARSAEIFDTTNESTIRLLPDLLGDYRTYPNTGGSVILPLSSGNGWDPDIVVCGGGSFQGIDSPTDASCGRIKPLSEYPTWEMDAMPGGRGMVEGTLLPDGTVLWLNGCKSGAQGFGVAKDPVYEAWIYDPKKALGHRWELGASSKVPRMYHSVALLLLDGTVMVAGSNPAEQPILQTDPKDPSRAFLTEFRVEIYIPPYLDGLNAVRRPTDLDIPTKYLPANGHKFLIRFNTPSAGKAVKIVLYHGGFVTHSVHMGHRMIYLDTTGFTPGRLKQEVVAEMPSSSAIAPPGPYAIYVVVDGIPSVGQFVMVE